MAFKKAEEDRKTTQNELDDLLMVFGDLEEKVAKYKVSQPGPVICWEFELTHCLYRQSSGNSERPSPTAKMRTKIATRRKKGTKMMKKTRLRVTMGNRSKA